MADAYNLHIGAPLMAQNAVSFSTFVLNQSADQFYAIFHADAADAISRLGVRIGAVTGTPPTYQISLQGVDGTGAPDGTIKSSSNAKATFTPVAGDANSWKWFNLTSPYSCSNGEALSLVVAYSSGTVDVSNNAAITTQAAWGGFFSNLPFTATIDNGAAATKIQNTPVFGYGSAVRAYGWPHSALYTQTVGLNTTPDEIGIKFRIPPEWCSTYRVAAVRSHSGLAAGQTMRLQLYDAGGSVLQTRDHDTDLSGSTTQRSHWLRFTEAARRPLQAGADYRLTFSPQAATLHTLYGMTLAAAADWDAYPGGQYFGLTQRTDGGAWTDTPTTRLFTDLVLADLSIPRRVRHRLGGYT
jgi:hypothetical protein